ncbi:MAG: HAMP domain-containing histidine kinase [Tannerellaceae bacterium]|jgi:signal transduction histidine kinase|nr:HAMP domain-containing histidine kinase [Tannerellaceae bacterium]
MNKASKLEALEKQLSIQEKMAALGSLSAGIVHEIQNPLNFVINFGKISIKLLEELEEALGDTVKDTDADSDICDIIADLKANISKIEENGARASRIIRSILVYSRGRDEFAPTKLPELVHEFAWLSFHAARANNKSFNASIIEKYEDDLPLINIIPQEISRVALNIMNNACYAVFARSKAASDAPYQPTITIEIQRQDNNIVLSIEDNGTGISDFAKSMLFTPFFTTKPIGEGTGLGLSISKSIIEDKHKGTLAVDSVQNQYTRFTITLPIS